MDDETIKGTYFRKVIEPGICVKQLMEVCNFESQAQLYRYFKQHFRCTPKQLIDHYQAKPIIFKENYESVQKESINVLFDNSYSQKIVLFCNIAIIKRLIYSLLQNRYRLQI